MQFKVGVPMLINGQWNNIRTKIYALSGYLQQHCRRILIIDTTNSLNPHHFAYNSVRQQDIFNKIYCVRTPKPYDLWARLQTTENFIKGKGIEALIFTSLTLFFEDAEEGEVRPLLGHILGKIEYLTKKFNLITLIGNSPSENANVILASETLSNKEKLMVMP